MGNRQSSIVNRQLPKTLHLGFAKVDAHRHERRGIPEVIYGESKTAEHIIEIIRAIESAKQNVLCTRISPEKAKVIKRKIKGLKYNPLSRTLMKTPHPRDKSPGVVLVMCAGTSDLSVAEEAAETLEFLGDRVERICDVGVAGIHRLLDHCEAIQSASVIVCVAGMEGALPSVVAGLTRAPVIAVPTSVGYGASFGGVTALLAMLNSCSGGVAVVNIDNGFGAAQFADQVLRRRG